MPQAGTKIVIVGGSFGGVNAAYALRRKLGRSAEITVIAKDQEFLFTPSLPWVIMGWRDPARIQVPLAEPLARRGIRFVHAAVEELDAAKGTVRTANTRFPYDHLVISAGAELDYAAVPGLGPAGGFTRSTFTVSEAVGARDALARALATDRGRSVMGAAQGVSCIADAGDTAYYFSADPFLPPRNKVAHKKGKWAHYLKLAFEKYYLARIRHDWPSVHFGW